MADLRYKAGIIGLGFIGAADQVSGDALGQRVEDLGGTHFTALSNNPRIDLVAGSSRDEGRRERFAKRSRGARIYSDWKEMLERENLDIVSVATYAPVHAEISIGCAETGVRAIYCEKPVATRIEDGERMVQVCEKSGTLLAINHNRRYEANYRRLRDLIAEDGLGKLTSVSVQWTSGRLGNVGTHMFDAVRMLTGRKVEAVSGTLDPAGRPDCRGDQFRDPGGWGTMRLEGGLMTTVHAPDYGMVSPVINIYGTEGRAVVGAEVTIEFGDGRQEDFDRGEVGSMDLAVAEIVAALDGGSPPFPYPAENAVRTLEAIVAFHASHARNAAWVELPLQGADREFEVLSG